MHKLSTLEPGDKVEIIAPASRCSSETLTKIKQTLESWQLICSTPENIFGDDLLCANADDIRFELLKNALENQEIKAVICARGGYGSMRLIPKLTAMKPPARSKLFIGMSDITALHLFLQQHWQWPTVHGAITSGKFSPDSIAAVKSLLFDPTNSIEFKGQPLNEAAKKNDTLESVITGGNLTLLQASIGTAWQVDSNNKIIFIEEVGERGYRIDRMLEHLHQVAIFEKAKAVIFGDFLNGNEPNGQSLIKPVLERFAQSTKIPVISIEGIGHGYTNFPLPLGTIATLTLGSNTRLICSR